MATNDDTNKLNDETLTLKEEDIPGAELLKPPEYCTVAILKRWLSCRGAKVTGTKNKLIKRVNDYISSGLDKNLIDPDGGMNLQQKRLKLGLVDEVTTAVSDFPTDGFEVGIGNGLSVEYSQIWKFLIEDVEFKKQLSVEKPIVKGYNFYKSGKVLGIYTKHENDRFYVKSQVMPSYATRGPVYTVKLVMNANCQIQIASCPCPAGNDGRCNHTAATLFAMEDIYKKAEAINQNQDDVPCPSKPCTWRIPKKRKQEATTVQSVKFIKHVYGKKEKECKTPTTCTPVNNSSTQQQPNIDYDTLLERIKAIEKKKGTKIGLRHIIPQQFTETSTVSSEAPIEFTSKWDIVSPVKAAPLSMYDIRQKSQRTKTRLYESVKDRQVINEKTKEQHKTKTWFDVRKHRITASKCKRCVMKPTTSPTKAISEVLMYNDRVTTKAMKEGIEAEAKIIDKFEKDSNLKVNSSGFVISKSHPFLGASPDGIIDEQTIVEVKNIGVKDGESHEDAMIRLGIYKKNGTELKINKNHSYYYQIQQQLFCTESVNCHFIVSSSIATHKELVSFDSLFWNEVLPKLEAFYFNHLFPELVYPRIFHDQPRWDKEIHFPRAV